MFFSMIKLEDCLGQIVVDAVVIIRLEFPRPLPMSSNYLAP